jgi:hypothetical protein
MVAALHFTEGALALHLLLERLQRLIDVVIADENLYQDPSPVTNTKNPTGRVRCLAPRLRSEAKAG